MAAAPLVAIASLTAAKGITGYAAARGQARAAVAEGDYQSRIYGVNADLADQQAEDAVARGVEASNKLRTQTKGLMGQQRVAYTAGGVDPTVGSAAAIAADTSALSELDRITIANNAAREAYGFHAQSAGFRMQGQLARMAGRNAAAAYRAQGYSTLLGSAAELAHLYYASKK
jgi:hypothetical protein